MCERFAYTPSDYQLHAWYPGDPEDGGKYPAPGLQTDANNRVDLGIKPWSSEQQPVLLTVEPFFRSPKCVAQADLKLMILLPQPPKAEKDV